VAGGPGQDSADEAPVEEAPAEAREGPVDVDSAGVYEGLRAEDLGYGSLRRVGEDDDADDPPPPPRGGATAGA
jgi:hypothetical protein